MGYAEGSPEARAELAEIMADPELAAALAADERLCRAAHAVEIAQETIRMTYAATNEEVNRYGLLVVRDAAWRVVAAGLSEMRGYPVHIVAVAPRWRGRRCIPRFKAVRA